ncbi:L-2-aminoadipate reductase large subunit [Golovinomyces cichoracearum]|uniref:Alpha-aminoadipate reductase n=1 Tax=Golovinomyces cichoracearum TaxID=62708 RepID=A0A420III8_9PEZI|nr:L-2-aminoadipate reductase large subunit [Golovinomyces cichoracearum]
MSHLPDPTIDLDWSGYDGSIQWHFCENAKKFPDRTCVVETKSSKSAERVFTYKQIFEASNILAHFLCINGIGHGDVVMIWAHRSVDLVVSIMGTLASGATFSVLDPGYPPARQQIYLEVSQPRALIKIARATDEAGQLAPAVQKYISEGLSLKTKVPALRLGDDGFLFGNDSNEVDIFSSVRAKSTAPPDVEVGPDSNPTLSFTSGSEGKPKGVLGRHFSLVEYFTWMAERFELSKESRFTLLSGIAHDPVQRDIFTPLFLGAQLLVPPKEDIQHEKLAEWMAQHRPTVTHLTPAMGQILVGGSEAEFSSLERAFFVGDILTKRDCRSLQRLAANVNIVNMYGTTETQRAVSYFEIPSRAKDPDALDQLKDTIPAGKGMKNVQLLVINLEDRSKLCKVGEVGEIYVRAAGLAEGYKGDSASNDKKFYMNWFVDNQKWIEADKKSEKGESWRKFYKGPRDRLYRTGDLGKYLESGDVVCTGRADDQVKIRGFRIELNEINSNLLQHSLVRDCKTLVRRDKDEEPNLVSYIVPEAKKWPNWLESHNLEEVKDEGIIIGPTKYYPKKYRRLQTELRDHLKGLLPEYAVPSIIIFLEKLPLNPNGKVDKPNLPFPDITELTERASKEDLERWQSLTQTERMVATKWSDLIRGLDPKTVSRHNDFFDLGGHSILAQQMLLHIRRETGANISINTLYEFPSLEGFSAHVEEHLNSGKSYVPGVEIVDYAKSLDELVKMLPSIYHTAEPENIRKIENPTVLVTGATGFLGAYIIKEILSRKKRCFSVIAHIRNAKDPKTALLRVTKSLRGYNIWEDSWEPRLSCVIGDLSKPKLGLSSSTWESLAHEVDIVIHNGAIVHWVKNYPQMMSSNVLSTIDAMSLCNTGKPKIFTFISSTSVLDTDHYISLSDRNVASGRNGLLESDALQGSRTKLKTGYGQTKWVSEQLVLAAGLRGLCGSIIRPGYILGDKETGVCNTDDFLIRLLKGCIQLSSRPRIFNTVNAIPVNHVALLVTAASLNPLAAPTPSPSSSQPVNHVHVIHGTAHPRLRMSEFLASLEYYGYMTPEVDYDVWKNELENYVSAGGPEKDIEQHALMPLFHFCINDLPATTRAPELDDRNAVTVLKDDAQHWTGVNESLGCGISREYIGQILAYLVQINFIPRPKTGHSLDEILSRISSGDQTTAAHSWVGGRGGMNN